MKARWMVALVAVLGLIACQAADEVLETPTAPSGEPLTFRIPVSVISAGGQAAGLPTATPTPTPAPDPSPEATPEPTPDPDNCPGLGITLDAHCAGSSPDCGIDGSSKSPNVHRGSKVILDVSYYLDAPRNKVHAEHECYPGPIDGWSVAEGAHCREPYSDNHVMVCGPYESRGSFTYGACGAGLCGEITVLVD